MVAGRPVRRIDHVGVVVRDARAEARTWVDRFGLRLMGSADVLDGTVRLVYLDCGDTTLQLVQPLGPGTLADHLDERGEGLHHLCFLVDDLREAAGSLGGSPGPYVYRGGRGADVCFVDPTPCGVLIELTEPGDGIVATPTEASRDDVQGSSSNGDHPPIMAPRRRDP